MQFWRIVNEQISIVDPDTNRLGFEKSNALYIPDEYLAKGEFLVMRTCFGIGDVGIITGMPRLLKRKYPNSKVYLPSKVLLRKIFGSYLDQWGYGRSDSKNIYEILFKANPYVDGYLDEYKDDIFHDHYRIYNKDNIEIPLLEQMLDFWQFESYERSDSQPDIWFTKEEKEEGDRIIDEYMTGTQFGYLLLSDLYHQHYHSRKVENEDEPILLDVIKRFNMPYFYYMTEPIENTNFNFIEGVNVKDLNLDIRIQMYLKYKARLNVGSQTGLNDIMPRYSETIVLGHKLNFQNEDRAEQGSWLKENVVRGINYINIGGTR